MNNVSLIDGHIDEAKDLVEVVRCKDCKWCDVVWYPCKSIKEDNPKPAYFCKVYNQHREPTHFCSYGERRGKEE